MEPGRYPLHWAADQTWQRPRYVPASATFNWETVEEVKLREKGMDIYSNQEKVGITIWGWQLIVMGFFLGIGIELGILLIKYLTAS